MSFLSAVDHWLFFAVHQLQKFNLDYLLAWPTYLGSLKLVLPLLFILLIFQSREKILRRAFLVFFPVLCAYQVTEFLKTVFKRDRPFKVFESMPETVTVIFERPESFSFPSGHATTAFATAVILSACFKVPRWAAFGAAAFICLTRLYVGVHFPFDVIAGALCGILVTSICLHFLKPVTVKNPG